jgi:hypothetical protein
LSFSSLFLSKISDNRLIKNKEGHGRKDMDWLQKHKDQEEVRDIKEPKLDAKRPKRSEAPRTNLNLKIDINILGSDHTYHLETKNISTSGMLVECENLSLLPFKEKKTIIRCTLFLEDFKDRNSTKVSKVEFMGKVIRFAQEPEGTEHVLAFGLKIIDISSKDLGYLEELIAINNSLISMNALANAS